MENSRQRKQTGTFKYTFSNKIMTKSSKKINLDSKTKYKNGIISVNKKIWLPS